MMADNASDDNKCGICLEYMGDAGSHTPFSLQCGHVFGRHCIVRWSETSLTCPLCRHEFSEQELALPESLIKRVLFSRTIACPSTGLVAYANYLERPEQIMTTVALMFLTLITATCLFLTIDVAIWCLRGRNYSLSRRVHELMKEQLNVFVDMVIGISVGVVLAAYVKQIR